MKKMHKRLSRGLGLGLGISLLVANVVFAADLNYSADVTVTIGTANYTILSGSAATTVIIAGSTITVTVPAASTFTLSSPDRYKLANDGGLTQTCGASTNNVTITGPATVLITPDETVCSSGGGGGGGGGGGAAAPTPSPTPAPTPSAGSHPNGTLVIYNGTVYLIKDGRRVGFRNADEYRSHGYYFGQVVAANAQDMALPQAEFVQKALEGTLVLDSSDGRTVYMIGTGNTKRGFTSASVFNQLGYNFNNLPRINLTDYPAGEPVADANLPHPDGALVLQNGTVWWIRGNMRQGFESAAVFNTYGFDWAKIVSANAADLALSEGALVKFRDGTLVYDGTIYYLISDGMKKMFSSASDMMARGYNTANAINASLAAYASGGTVQ